MWKLRNMMGKITLLYLSMSLPRIPNILWGGLAGGREGRGSCIGCWWPGNNLSLTPFLPCMSLGRVSCPPPFTAHVIMQHEWSWTWVCTHEKYANYFLWPWKRKNENNLCSSKSINFQPWKSSLVPTSPSTKCRTDFKMSPILSSDPCHECFK